VLKVPGVNLSGSCENSQVDRPPRPVLMVADTVAATGLSFTDPAMTLRETISTARGSHPTRAATNDNPETNQRKW
jgi:hypothetical protein